MTITTAVERHRGYELELAAHSIDVDPHLVRVDVRGIERAEAAAIELLSMPNPPTALFTSQNLLGIADMLEPGITVVAQDPATMGRRAAELLFRRTDGDQSPSAHLVVPTHLITRGSGELRP